MFGGAPSFGSAPSFGGAPAFGSSPQGGLGASPSSGQVSGNSLLFRFIYIFFLEGGVGRERYKNRLHGMVVQMCRKVTTVKTFISLS